MLTTSESCNKIVLTIHDTKREFSKFIRTVTTALWLFLFVRQNQPVEWHGYMTSLVLIAFSRYASQSVSDCVCRRLRLVPKALHVLSAIRRCLSVHMGVSNLLRCPCPTSAWSRCLVQMDKLQLNPFVVSQYSYTCFFFSFFFSFWVFNCSN